MIHCAFSSPPFTGVSAVSPITHATPTTTRLPPGRISATCARALHTSAAAERYSGYMNTGAAGGRYTSSSSSSRLGSTSAPPTSTAPSLYDVLGISTRATAAEIKAAYRRLARSCHPDAAQKGNHGDDGASAEQFMRVHAAYTTLSDPGKRAEYDRGLAVSMSSADARRGRQVYRRTAPYPVDGGTPGTWPAYSEVVGLQSGFGRRTWETDQCW